MQQAISYVISNLAKIADVKPSDVESSLRQRTLRFRDLALRKETLNKILPIPILSGHISDLLVEIPWPVPNKPLIIHPHGVTMTLDPLGKSTGIVEMSLEEIQDGITDESILGVANTSTTMNDIQMEEQEELPATPPLRSDAELEDMCESPEVDDDDYMSCRSDTDTSNSSFDFVDDTIPPLVEEERWGLFSFIRNAASQSVSWLINRPIHVHFVDVNLIIPCDSSNGTRFEIVAKEVLVQSEPSQQVSTERMKVVTITFNNITVNACTPKGETKVIVVENLTVRVTSVYNNAGILCRKNTAIIFEGVTSLFSDEDALESLTKCIVSHRIMTEVPEYCRPFSELRRQRSHWAYARNCVLSLVREKRKRYNFNPAHLNFYAEARNSYLRLLDYCHRTGDVAEKRNSLAEVERDLRYRDVVMLLRRKAYERYSASSSRGECRFENAPQESNSVVPSAVVSSLHVDVRVVCIYLPAKTTMWINDIAFVTRVEEISFSIRSISVKINGIAQALHKVKEEEPFFSFQRTEKNDIVLVRIKLDEFRFAAESGYILNIMRPFIIATSQCLSNLPEQNSALSQSSQTPPSIPSNRRLQTITFVFPLIQFQIDDLLFFCEKLSLTAVDEISGRKRIGFLLKEVYLRFGKNDLILSPVKVEMKEKDDIVVSVIAINVSDEFLKYISGLRNAYIDTISAVHNSDKSGRNVTTTRDNKYVSATLNDIWSVIGMKDEFNILPNSQEVLFLGIQCDFHPLKMKMTIGSLNVSQGNVINNIAGFSLNASSLMILIDYFDNAPLCVDLPSGFHCVTSVNKNEVSCLLITLDTIQVFWKVISPLNLLNLCCVKMALCGDLSYCSADKVHLFEIIEFTPLKGLYRRDLSAIPTTTRPFLASSLQIYMNITEIWIYRLSSVDFGKLSKLMNELISFFIDHVVSVEAYRLFFSSLSDIALLLSGSSCPVFFDKTNALMCRISMPAVDNSVAKLPLNFGELLPEMRNVSLLTMINACDVLSVALSMPILRVELFHSRFPSINVYTEIQFLSGKLPMAPQDFWDPIIGSTDSNTLELTCSCFDFHADPIAKLEVSDVKYTQSNTLFNGDSSTVLSDSELGSGDGSSTVSEDISYLEVKGWSLGSNTSPGTIIMNDLFGLWKELEYMANSFLVKRIITYNHVPGGKYDLEKTGPWFFNCPGEVIIVEDCTFLFKDTGVQMVVCSGSYVYFRRCRFLPSLQDTIRVEDDNAAFVCDNCEECATYVDDIPHDTQSEVEKKTTERYYVNINRGRVNLDMSTDRKVVVAIPSVDVHIITTSRKIFSQVRVHRCRWEYIEENIPHALLSRLDVDVDCSFRQKDQRAKLSVAIRSGGASIPLCMIKTVQGVISEWKLGGNSLVTTTTTTTTTRTFVVPSKRKEPPVVKWICLLTTSVFPLDFSLPSGVSFTKLTIPNISICSKRLVAEETFVEFQIGAQDLVIWEFSSQSFVPLLRKPLTLVVVLRTIDFSTATCDVSISPLDLSLSSEQVKCALSLMMFIHGEVKHKEEGLSPWCTMYIDNEVGVPLLLESATEKIVVQHHLALEKKRLLFPHSVKEVGGRKVDHFEKADPTIPNEDSSCLLQTVDVAVLDNDEKVYMTSCVKSGSLVQHVIFRTTFHIMNVLPCTIKLYSPNNADAVVVVQPKEVSCIPLCYLDSTDVVISLISLNEKVESTEELLSEISPRDLFEVAVSRGEESIGRLKEFNFGKNTAYVDITYRLQGMCLTMWLAPARPSIHNGTHFPLKVSIFLENSITEETIVKPGDTLVSLKYDPFGKQLNYRFGCVLYGKNYVADEPISLDAVPPLVGESIVMKHEQYPRRHFFELSIERQRTSSSYVGIIYSVLPRHVFGVVNNSFVDVEITSESGDSVGTLGGEMLSCASGINFAYIPFHTPLVLHAGKAISTPFEVKKEFEERMILCDISDNNEVMGVSHSFLLRTLKTDEESFMELIPALFFVNKDSTRSLLVKHVIRPTDSKDDSEWVQTIFVPASGVLPYTTLSRYGYTNFFSFAWEGNTNDTDYSQPVEAMLSSNTDWTGYVQCGNTHHIVQIRKESLFDTAVVAISAPRLPYLTLVNLTPRTYDLVQSMSVSLCTPSSVNNDEVFLDDGDTKIKIPLSQNMSTNVFEGVTVFVQTQRESVTVILSLIPINKGVFLLGDSTYEDASLEEKSMLRVDVKSSSVLLTFRDAGDHPLQLGVEGSEFWFVYQSPKITAQCTVSDAYVESSYKGKKNRVVKPFCFDMTIRDVGLDWNSISVLSTQINLTQLELEVSDVLVYQLQQLGIHCLPHSFSLEKNTSSTSFTHAKELQFVKNKRIKLVSLIICEVSILITYDRSVRPPQDVLFRGSPIGSLIPSLHRATMQFPTLQLRDISGDSMMEVVDVVRGVLFVEFLKQIPKLLTSVVLFPSLSPIGSMLSRVGSFVFGSGDSSSELPGTTLI
ncbi:uncharacterized protein TM35_000272340 [Trypanosoma theileri]|uniref:Uncharacterized protein n=1 Tax=Trypanosoma theileri TaxID=67003 RepID=A0A1X0NPL8_9TRYP|nr:uncharacterized protein TM35_000272340 [Trypanosoma theileri]ORC86644.1 hypothetical protein TM35_000272340 [Trypanosoma theileri]